MVHAHPTGALAPAVDTSTAPVPAALGLVRRFRAHVQGQGLLPTGTTAVVGVSGRGDSVALLHLLKALSSDLRLALVVAHVQHGASAEAAEDAKFVRSLAERLGLRTDLFLDEEPAPAAALQAAERVRYFAAVRARLRADVILTGETADDGAEIFLEHLLRGAEPPWPMLVPRTDTTARPLLAFTHDECRAFLDDQNLLYRVDDQALHLDTTRKKLRLLVLPIIRRHVAQDAIRHLAGGARAFADDAWFLAEVARAARAEVGWADAQDGVSLDLVRWSALPSALRRRVLADALLTVDQAAAPIPSVLQGLAEACPRLADGDHLRSGTLNIARRGGTLSVTKHGVPPSPIV